MKKIALVVNDNFTMWRFRRGLITALVEHQHRVYTITPPGEFTQRIEALGARHITVTMARFINPITDLLTMARLYRVFRRERFDIVHNMQIKPSIFGAVAARAAGVRRITALVPGLGYPFFVERPGIRLRLLGGLILQLLRLGFRYSDKIWFQNPDDLDFCVARGILPAAKAVLIRGGGIRVDEFSESAVDAAQVASLRGELGLDGATRIVTMVVARLIWSKGVKEFVEAAAIIGRRSPTIQFLLVGPVEADHPDSVATDYLAERNRDNLRVVAEFREDVREILAMSDVVVLPSYFREGVPRVLLEALSLGKPIVTTDRPGCREVVEDWKNGFLVPVRDAGALAEAIARIIDDESLRKRFGQYSRQKAEAEFDERRVVRAVMRELYGFESV